MSTPEQESKMTWRDVADVIGVALVEHAEFLRTPGICGREEFANRWQRASLLDDLATVLSKALTPHAEKRE